MTAAAKERARVHPLASPAWTALAWRAAVLAVFAAWVFVVGSHHEPWFDESQSWLLARDNGLWTLLAERVRYEGSPGLWHLVLWLAIRAGLPFSKFFVLPACCAVAGAAVVLWRAPFPGLLRVAILGSYFFGYQYSVVARSYSLDLVLVPLAAAFFAARVERPLRYALVVGLLANLNAYSFLAAGALGLELAWRIWQARHFGQPRSLAALVLAGGLGLFALWSAWQPGDNSFLGADMKPNPVLSATAYVCNALLDRLSVWSFGLQSKVDIFAAVVLSALLQRPVARLVMAGRNRALLAAMMGMLIALSAAVYADHWVTGTFFLFWLFLLWVEWGNPVCEALRRQLVAAVALVCVMQAVQTVRTGLWDIGHVYSPGREAAAALVAYRAGHPGARIDAYGFKAFEVQPWLAGNPYTNYHNGAAHPAYIVWNKREPWSPKDSIARWQALLATGPDLIVASRVDFTGKPEPLGPVACRMGYGVRRAFPGAVIWRGAITEDATLYLFERGAPGSCIGPAAQNAALPGA